MTRGATGAIAACASVVTGRDVVFRTGVNPVRGLFRLLGVVIVAPLSAASTPSDVNPWTGAGSSTSSGAARFLPATVVIGRGSGGLQMGAFAGSSVFARKTDEACSFSGVLRPSSVDGPDIAREREGGVDGAAMVESDDLVYRAGAAARGC